MPLKAKKYENGNWNDVEASKSDITDTNRKFICCTDGCKARMTLISSSDTKKAYFRSLDKKEHISNKCIKNSIKFNPSEYNETLFDLDFAFGSMLGGKKVLTEVKQEKNRVV